MKNEDKKWCVYMHTSPSNKVYIGITCDVKHRWRNHGEGYKGGTRIYYAIRKYGWENFKHEILFTNLTREEAFSKEFGVNLSSIRRATLKHSYTCQGLHFMKVSDLMNGDTIESDWADSRVKNVMCVTTGKKYNLATLKQSRRKMRTDKCAHTIF